MNQTTLHFDDVISTFLQLLRTHSKFQLTQKSSATILLLFLSESQYFQWVKWWIGLGCNGGSKHFTAPSVNKTHVVNTCQCAQYTFMTLAHIGLATWYPTIYYLLSLIDKSQGWLFRHKIINTFPSIYFLWLDLDRKSCQKPTIHPHPQMSKL